jgi:anti-sigma factor RsiW
MCPEPQLLSIYMDGELPSPWKEKMETHLAECPECAQRYKNFRHLQEMFKKNNRQSRTFVESDGELRPTTADQSLPEQEFIESAKEKVWQKMESKRRYCRRSVWSYKLSLPLPAVAAAAAFILVILTVFFIRGGNLNPQDSAKSNFILASEEEEMPSVIPAAQDMNGFLQLLGSDGSDVLILRLPESRNFSRSGEPAIIRAADYSRSYP